MNQLIRDIENENDEVFFKQINELIARATAKKEERELHTIVEDMEGLSIGEDGEDLDPYATERPDVRNDFFGVD